jgi:hypothetical protein
MTEESSRTSLKPAVFWTSYVLGTLVMAFSFLLAQVRHPHFVLLPRIGQLRDRFTALMRHISCSQKPLRPRCLPARPNAASPGIVELSLELF